MWGDLFAENIIYGDNDILSGILFLAETCRESRDIVELYDYIIIA